MKRKLLPFVLLTLITSVSMNAQNIEENPLIKPWNTPYETPPFDQIKTEHYVPAFKYAIKMAKEDIRCIKQTKGPATYANTIEKLEHSGMLLSRISNVFFNMLECDASEDLQKIAYDIMPMVTEYGNDVNLDPVLFQRVNAVYKQKATLKLTPEQKMLLDKTYRGFVRSGANLTDEQKATYRDISNKLSDLSLKFKDNLLKETNSFTLDLTNKDELKGLPESVLAMAEMTAKSKGKTGWVFDLSAPSYGAFMKYSENRDLRKKMFIAYATRCFKGNEYDNSANILQFAELRLKMANLLGYKTYADYVLEERMAKSAVNVNGFLQKLLDASLPAARNDVKELQDYAKQKGLDGDLQRWDWAFYTQQLMNDKFQINDELLKPYFELEKVKKGVFALANKLYGLNFKENTKISVYNPDVTAYEVTDQNGKFLAILYLDFFPRETKSSGAWMTVFREQYKMNGVDHRPLVQIVTNFTKPTADKPALLTFDEVNTFLHEFGHSLHGMLSDVTYSSLAGTSVYRDFVELPSQIMENFTVEKQFLDLFAFHYQTNQPIPAELIKKIKDYNNFQAGYQSVRQLSFAMIDMSWHSINTPITISVGDFEKNAISKTSLMPEVENSNMSVAFSHIFDGGYAAGYYGYKWAEVLDADAFSKFQKNGIFDKATATSFRTNILTKGGTQDPSVLYKKFRGQDPTIDALLIRSGLKK